MKKNDSNIKKAIKYLNNNDCIAIPTETVYGLAGNAYSDKAVSKIYKLKGAFFHRASHTNFTHRLRNLVCAGYHIHCAGYHIHVVC